MHAAGSASLPVHCGVMCCAMMWAVGVRCTHASMSTAMSAHTSTAPDHLLLYAPH